MNTSFEEVLLETDPARQADKMAELARDTLRSKVISDHGFQNAVREGELDPEVEAVVSAEALVQAVERLDAFGEASDSAAQALALELNHNGKFHAVNESETFQEALGTAYADADARGAKYFARMVEAVPKLAANAGIQPKELIAPSVKSKTEEAVGAYNKHKGKVPAEVLKGWVEIILDPTKSRREFINYLRSAGWRTPRRSLLPARIYQRKETAYFIVRCDDAEASARIEALLGTHAQLDPINKRGAVAFIEGE